MRTIAGAGVASTGVAGAGVAGTGVAGTGVAGARDAIINSGDADILVPAPGDSTGVPNPMQGINDWVTKLSASSRASRSGPDCSQEE